MAAVMVTGGQTANQLLASTEVYDPASGSVDERRLVERRARIAHRDAFDKRAGPGGGRLSKYLERRGI